MVKITIANMVKITSEYGEFGDIPSGNLLHAIEGGPSLVSFPSKHGDIW